MEFSQIALLVIDMQADYIGKTSKYNYYPIALVGKINERIALAVERNETIIYVKNAGRRGQMPYVSDFVDNLSIEAGYLVQKKKLSAFDNPALLNILNEHNISTVETIGIDGNCCVAASALDAAGFGFSAIFPLEYIGIMSRKRFLKTKKKLCDAGIQVIDTVKVP